MDGFKEAEVNCRKVGLRGSCGWNSSRSGGRNGAGCVELGPAEGCHPCFQRIAERVGTRCNDVLTCFVEAVVDILYEPVIAP